MTPGPRPTFVPLTEVAGAEGVLRSLTGQADSLRSRDTDPQLRRLLSHQASVSDVAQVWKSLMDADSNHVPRDPTIRNLTLVALLVAFERFRKHDYRGLKIALGRLTTLSGRPLSVIGTRCEIASRTAEGLYLEARRNPGESVSGDILRLVDQLMTATLTDCRQRDDPSYAKRWRGIRGVCRLMLGVQDQSGSVQSHLEQFLAAAADLEASFLLGNRGASAAAYLLDCLMHVLTLEYSDATRARLESVIASLHDDEKRNRSVLMELGRYAFARSFQDAGGLRDLDEALSYLNEALTYAAELASDDAFLRLIRGQVLVRLFMSLQDVDAHKSMEVLSEGIVDLKCAFEGAPEKYGNQRSLQSALVSRAENLLRVRRYAEAKADIEYLLSRPQLRDADAVAALRAEITGLVVDLRRASDGDDLGELERALRVVLEHSECANQAMIAASMAAKLLFYDRAATDDPALLQKTIEVMESVDVDAMPDPASRRMHLSLQGRLCFMLGATWNPDVLGTAVDCCVRAIDTSAVPPEPELLALCGESSLQFAKYCLQKDEHSELAIAYLEQAGDCFLRAAQDAERSGEALRTSFQLVVGYSKAGEAYLRLCGLTGATEDGEKSVESFEKARALGNATPQLLGLQGDAYYRLFRITREPEMLARAIAKKSEARDAGGESRENLSLSAKLSLMQWEASAKPDDLAAAIRLSAEAHEFAPEWPWPPFQLAEILDSVDPFVGETAIRAATTVDRPLRLLERVVSGGREALIEFGCTLVIANDEFAKKTLGGRQPVYVLEDSHRLLSASYVFKHTETASAHRDRDVIRKFSAFLRQRNLTDLGLPTPIAIVPQHRAQTAVYVMRRARGHHLGRLAVRARRTEQSGPILEFERALVFLAAFHAWGDSVRVAPTEVVLNFVKAYVKESLGMPLDVLPASTRQALSSIGGVPQALKKDAHPENWLIDDRGRLSMIDFESSKFLPIPFEVVQLLDDYPLLPASAAGWDKRMELCRKYMTALAEFCEKAVVIEPASVDVLYAIMLVLRARFGFQHATRSARGPSSSSALRARDSRLAHYREILAWLSTEHPSQGVREFATAVVDHAARGSRLG